MANYYDRDDERYRENERYARGNDYGRSREERSERDRGWGVGREDPSRYGTGWPDEYERGYSSRYYTGDDQGRGFAGGRDFGRSYTPSYDRASGEGPSSGRGYHEPYNRSRYSQDRDARDYQGTNRPPDYGRDYQTSRYRSYRGEGLAGDRDWFDRASDEVSSWFGDQDAERRRRMDKVRQGNHRGRGPKGYRRSDERIKEDVSDRLAEHAYLDASEIEVAVKDAEVTLSGTVTHRRDKRAAEDLAEDVSGVKNVQNNLRVSETKTPSTAGMANAASARGTSL